MIDTSIVNRVHVLQALARIDAHGPAPFQQSTTWDLVYGERHYPPKAVAEFAYEAATGERLSQLYRSFTGSHDGPWHKRLTDLGFTLRRKRPLDGSVTADFQVGQHYSREDVMTAAGVSPIPKGGNWFTGYHQYQGAFYVFCGVGTGGRTGHDYANRFEGEQLVWRGKTGSTATQPTIAAMTAPGAVVHLFYRSNDRERFTYAGRAVPASINRAAVPVEIRWTFTHSGADAPCSEEVSVPPNTSYVEGATATILVNAYERNAEARRQCLKAKGTVCIVCRFDFAKSYGAELGGGFIHVHHVRPLSEIGESYQVDPQTDLVPVCPNCHAMLHRRSPPLSLEELSSIWSSHGGGKDKTSTS